MRGDLKERLSRWGSGARAGGPQNDIAIPSRAPSAARLAAREIDDAQATSVVRDGFSLRHVVDERRSQAQKTIVLVPDLQDPEVVRVVDQCGGLDFPESAWIPTDPAHPVRVAVTDHRGHDDAARRQKLVPLRAANGTLERVTVESLPIVECVRRVVRKDDDPFALGRGPAKLRGDESVDARSSARRRPTQTRPIPQ